MKNLRTKIKIISILAVSFVVFFATLFALAQNQNGNSLFLDSDQDGLTDQEERMIGTDPGRADTDGDGYSDGKEVESGYNPLKPSPGDKIVISTQNTDVIDNNNSTANNNETSEQTAGLDLLGQLNQNDIFATDAANDLTSDPNNPNLTNEMIGQLMQLTENKLSSSDGSSADLNYTASDYEQIAQNALQTVDITKDLPEIQDSELNILPEIKGKNLSEDEMKKEQKAEIEKYLAQVAFVMASNSPFTVENSSDLQSNINIESTNLITALATGDVSKVDSYAAKAQTGIDQLKKVAVPYILKDIHKSMLALTIYTVDLKDDITINATDPMKSLVAASSLQSVAQSAVKIQNEFTQILDNYGIEFINFP
ncbi:MAG: hypothetical protein A3J76_06095 [Candidatus Moranbacteria bacterium RBG_13_45_13]|nr:MAG: hypothetical protein A3J76_06095 [Candidatus Moranbacteria bacterium RBG_13_45_13]